MCWRTSPPKIRSSRNSSRSSMASTKKNRSTFWRLPGSVAAPLTLLNGPTRSIPRATNTTIGRRNISSACRFWATISPTVLPPSARTSTTKRTRNSKRKPEGKKPTRRESHLDLTFHIKRARTREHCALSLVGANQIATTRRHLPRLQRLLAEPSCPEGRQRTMRRPGHRVFRHSLIGRKETRNEIISLIALRRCDQSPKPGFAQHARDFARPFEIAHMRSIVPHRNEITPLEQFRWRLNRALRQFPPPNRQPGAAR